MPKFRKKPVDVEARQFTDRQSARDIIDWAFKYGTDIEWVKGNGVQSEPYLVIHTLEGKVRAVVGSWVVRGNENEFWPIKESIFANTYERVYDGLRPFEDPRYV